MDMGPAPTKTSLDTGHVRLVLAVARMGERDIFGWWRSHGLSTTGGSVLPVILRRTWPLAALQLDVVSAARRHDEALGRLTAIHLFSDQLPFKRQTMEWLVAQKLESRPHELVEFLRGWTPQTATSTLRAWAGPTPATAETIGDGLRLGSLRPDDRYESAHLDALAHDLAAAYLAADCGQLRFPYVDLT